ncbi:MAG: c-type cytochrome [Deltaproteobacteria bacterium]|nr:c-type cytochrome [Deltaproteobacteria bacterium]
MRHSAVCLALCSILFACEDSKPPPKKPALQAETTAVNPTEIDPVKLQLFGALPDKMPRGKAEITEERVKLGRILYDETRLSRGGELSCNSCHDLATYGVDHKKTSEGHKKQLGSRNSPTVYNAAGHISQFWDGRAADVEEQAKGPILNPIEMAMPDEKTVVAELKKVKEYDELFKKAFPGEPSPITYNNVANAIGAFERLLVTPSRWDKFLKGDKNALTAEEKIGFNKFNDTGCVACHSGVFVGGAMYQKMGLVKPYESKDLGRFEVTKQESDKMMFKVPSLRNVEKTGPYFHDGAVATIEDATKLMAKHQLGRELSDADTAAIVAWMKTLTGEIPEKLIARPELPGVKKPMQK